MDDLSSSDESESELYSPLGQKKPGTSTKKPIPPKKFESSKKSTDKFLVESKETFRANDPIGNEGLVVDPKGVRFDSIKPGMLYAMTFSLRNATRSAYRIRIQPPKSPYFALNYIPSGSVAPGLDIRAEIECQLPIDSPELHFSDVIVASMGPYTIELPLFASKPHAVVKFDSLVNFGYVPSNQISTVDVSFANIGDIPASVVFKQGPNTRVKFSSVKFDLIPNEKHIITLSYDAKETGSWRELVDVAIIGGLANEVLDINVQSVEQKLNLLAKSGGILDNIDFGNMIYGQKSSSRAILANSGPRPLTFVVTYPEDDEKPMNDMMLNGSENEGDESSYLEKKMAMSPVEGIVPPFSELPVMLKFEPQLFVPKNGFAKQFNSDTFEVKLISRKVIIEAIETGQKLNLSMSGNVVLPDVELNQDFFDFGDCPVNDRRDIRFTVTNKSVVKVEYSFEHNPHFKFTPSKGILQPTQTLSVISTFRPNQMGVFRNNFALTLCNGLRSIPLQVYGEAEVMGPKRTYVTGTDKLPEDFEVSYKFVDPIQLQETRRLKQLQATGAASVLSSQDPSSTASLGLLPSLKSKDRDEIYGMNSMSKSISAMQPEILYDESHPFFTRKMNDQTYTNFVRDSYKERQMKKSASLRQRILDRGGPDRSNPNGVDLGMERGLKEPVLQLPTPSNALWMANRAGEGAERAGRRIPIDENRCIQKKYSPNPSTQAELKDCTCELDADEIKMVHSSHKVSIFILLVLVLLQNFFAFVYWCFYVCFVEITIIIMAILSIMIIS